MGVSVKVNKASVRAALRAIQLVANRKSEAIRAQVAESAINIDREAKNLCPVDTGRLRASIHPEFSADGLDAQVVTNVEYSQYVELGTSRQPAQPFLFPAAEKEQPKFINAMKKILTSK